MEGTKLLDHALDDFSVLLFDFAGCGNSDGGFVTLGLNESDDLGLIIKHIAEEEQYKRVFLWGRSMGAVSIIHFLDSNKQKVMQFNDNLKKLKECKEKGRKRKKTSEKLKEQIMGLNKKNSELLIHLKMKKMVKGVVLDSPFTSARKTIKNILQKKMKFNKFMANIALMFLSRSIKNNIGKDVFKNNHPDRLVYQLEVPAAFFIGEKDDMIDLGDFQEMFDMYGADDKKLRVMANTGHATERTELDIKCAIRFFTKQIQNCLIEKDKMEKRMFEVDDSMADSESKMIVCMSNKNMVNLKKTKSFEISEISEEKAQLKNEIKQLKQEIQKERNRIQIRDSDLLKSSDDSRSDISEMSDPEEEIVIVEKNTVPNTIHTIHDALNTLGFKTQLEPVKEANKEEEHDSKEIPSYLNESGSDIFSNTKSQIKDQKRSTGNRSTDNPSESIKNTKPTNIHQSYTKSQYNKADKQYGKFDIEESIL